MGEVVREELRMNWWGKYQIAIVISSGGVAEPADCNTVSAMLLP